MNRFTVKAINSVPLCAASPESLGYSPAGHGRCGADQSSSVPTTASICADWIATVTAIHGRPLASDR